MAQPKNKFIDLYIIGHIDKPDSIWKTRGYLDGEAVGISRRTSDLDYFPPGFWFLTYQEALDEVKKKREETIAHWKDYCDKLSAIEYVEPTDYVETVEKYTDAYRVK